MANDIQSLSFEAALQELEKIVSSLESGDVSLKAHCQARLEEARLKVEQIRVPSDGTSPTEAEPFDG